MSFFGSIKRAFGFGEDPVEDEEEFADDTSVAPAPAESAEPADRTPSGDSAASRADSGGEKPSPESSEADADPNLAGDLFDGVIAVFNAALPDFVERCIDRDNQRSQLLASLDKALRDRLAAATVGAREKGLREIESDRARADRELQRLRETNRRLDERRNETNAARLSAERQKRALTDRVHDLENQVSKLEAEKEQFELEARSMMSRMRAAGVSATGEATASAPSANPGEAEALRVELTDARRRLSDSDAAAERLTSEIEKLNAALEQARAKQSVSDAMINGLQTTASEAREEARREKQLREETERKIGDTAGRHEALESELAAARDELAGERARRAEADKALTGLKQELARRDAEDRAVYDDIEKKLSGFEAVKSRLDQRIADLKSENRLLKAELETLRGAPAAAELRQSAALPTEPVAPPVVTDEPELPPYAAEAPAPAETPADGDFRLIRPEESPAPKKRGRKKSQPKISAIDEFMDNGEWFGAPSPEEEQRSALAQKAQAEDTFGYREPQKKQITPSDDQLSLW
ncbi:MAG: hypothetical protein NC336_08300 [Clostridium sp.]|nr:hypothetical protein [Clostridium sp.]